MPMHGPLHDGTLGDQPTEYLVAHIQEALAADHDVSELGVRVSLVAGRVFLTGSVSSTEQRDRAGAVAADVAGGIEICNDLEVPQVTGEPTTERLT
jgi:osmotically-inducible protein OsmY